MRTMCFDLDIVIKIFNVIQKWEGLDKIYITGRLIAVRINIMKLLQAWIVFRWRTVMICNSKERLVKN